MKKIGELNLGFSDAQNYTQRANKQMLTDVFVKNSYLTKLLQPNIYYLIGEKGTGKTAYAAYLSNNEYDNTKSILKFINGTDYEKFHELKKRKQIDVSGYGDIWKTIILLLLSKSVTDNDRVVSFFNKTNLYELTDAIDEYYNRAFSPEIVSALKIVDKSELAAELVSKHAKLGGGVEYQTEFSEQRLQMNLYYICKQFSDCLGNLKLTKDVVLFIDGIDVRPSQIPYDEYLDCIKGLANACWTLNTELFANVKDSKGQFRVVLLLRPDIFNSLNLQNATNKLVDNSVYLDWRTTYTEYSTSNLYNMGKKLLTYSQIGEDKKDDSIWEKYFDWKLISSSPEQREYDTAFMDFLRISLSRPRDIQRILKMIQELMCEKGMGDRTTFSYQVYDSDQFQNQYSEYFLSSLKDQLSFYYSEEDYIHFRKFFDFFNSPQFTFDEYQEAYSQYADYVLDNAKDIPQFVEDPKAFLQLLYDSNVITAIESDEYTRFFHFAYREKSPSNIAPKVPYGPEYSYRFHYGLYKKAKMGRYR